MTQKDMTHSELFFSEAKTFMQDLEIALERDKEIILYCKEVFEKVLDYFAEKESDLRIKSSVEFCLEKINDDFLYRKRCRECNEYITDRMHRLCDKCLSE